MAILLCVFIKCVYYLPVKKKLLLQFRVLSDVITKIYGHIDYDFKTYMIWLILKLVELRTQTNKITVPNYNQGETRNQSKPNKTIII